MLNFRFLNSNDVTDHSAWASWILRSRAAKNIPALGHRKKISFMLINPKRNVEFKMNQFISFQARCLQPVQWWDATQDMASLKKTILVIPSLRATTSPISGWKILTGLISSQMLAQKFAQNILHLKVLIFMTVEENQGN